MEKTEKKPGKYNNARKQAAKMANATKVKKEGMVFHEYPDYETYKEVQTVGNKAKIGLQHVQEGHIKALSAYLNDAYGDVDFGLCHGTRRGLEQTWFRDHLNGKPEVIGTEISDTATEFPHTVQWDFHDENPEWEGKADFVYSNSWDHSFDPRRAFRTWAGMLKPGGMLILDHCKGHEPKGANALDPFGATYDALRGFIDTELADLGSVVDEIDRSDDPDYKARVLVFKRAA